MNPFVLAWQLLDWLVGTALPIPPVTLLPALLLILVVLPLILMGGSILAILR